MRYSKEDIAEAMEAARRLCPPGTVVFCKLNHVSSSGMSRSIAPFVIKEGEPQYLTWPVSVIFGQKRDKWDGVRMVGCGMDMGFALVYNLSRILYPNGYGLSMRKRGDQSKARTPESREDAAKLYAIGYRAAGCNGDASGWDYDGGYALNQRWM